MEKNEAILKDLTDELYIIEANEKIPGNCKYQAKLLQVVKIKNKQVHEVYQNYLNPKLV